MVWERKKYVRSADVKLEPWPRQDQAINSKATEMLFGGASEGGKSHFIRLALIKWCTEVKGLQCLILRKYYKDVISNHMEGENNFRVMLKPWVEGGFVKITEDMVRFLWNGSQITMAQCRNQEDFDKAQGITKHVLVWDEATQINPRFINDIRGWVRMSNEMKATLPPGYGECFPRIVYTCNPIGPSVNWFRRNFITCRKPFEMEKVGAFTRQFIPSLVTDNPSADPVAQRERLSTMHNPQVAEALISGNWDLPTGDYFPEYDEDIHVTEDFTPPKHWFKYRTFDWGSAEPFCVLWICVSDGEKFKDERGNYRWFPRGAVIVYREWYGCDPVEPSKGLRMRNEDIAKGIVARTEEPVSGLTFSDSYPFADRGQSKNHMKWTMADDFADNGCRLVLGNTARIYGWKQLRSRLQGVDGVPMIYVCRGCTYLRMYLPTLGFSDTNPEDAAESGEATHACFSGDTLVLVEGKQVKRIDSLKIGDKVIAGDGLAREISFAGIVSEDVLYRVTFTNGDEVKCTGDHKFLTNQGFMPILDIDALRLSCIVGECQEYYLESVKNSTERFILRVGKRGIFFATVKDYIEQFGSIIKGISQRGIMSITSTMMSTIMRFQILPSCQQGNIVDCMGLKSEESKYQKIIWKKQDLVQLNGINQKKGESGIRSITKILNISFIEKSKRLVLSVGKVLLRGLGKILSIVPQNVNKKITLKLKEKQDRVLDVKKAIHVINSQNRSFVVSPVTALYIKSIERLSKEKVYCLTEPVTGSFALHNGLVVSNCDCARLGVSIRPIISEEEKRKDINFPSSKTSLRVNDIIGALMSRSGESDYIRRG